MAKPIAAKKFRQNPSGQTARWLGPVAVLILLTFAAYFPALSCAFIWDDDAYVLNNQQLRTFKGLQNIWFDVHATPQYYPLVHTSFWIEYQLWQLRPGGYHLTNILLHGLSAALLWRILRFLNIPAAWFAAALFAVHPMHVESVAWITERKNVLSAFFYLASAGFYLRWALSGEEEKRNHRFYIFAFFLFIAALLSKTVTATLPAVLLVILWWKKDKFRIADALPLIPFFAVGVFMGLLTAWLERTHVGAEGAQWDSSFLERILIASRAVCFYAIKLIFPSPLIFIYPRWIIRSSDLVQYIPLGTVAVSLGGLWLLRKRITLAPLLAVLMYMGSLFPALGFFNVYPMRYSFVADHFAYIASIPLLALAAAWSSFLFRRFFPRRPTLPLALGGLVLALLGTFTFARCPAYQNQESLWKDTIDKNPSAWMAYNNLGLVYNSQNKFDLAIECYQKTIQLKPDHAEAHNNWATVLLNQEKFEEAKTLFDKAIQLKPDYAAAWNNLGSLYGRQGDYLRAIECITKALELKPDFAAAHYGLANTYRLMNDLLPARSHFEAALQYKPHDTSSLFYLSLTCNDLGDLPAAHECLRKLKALNPALASSLQSQLPPLPSP